VEVNDILRKWVTALRSGSYNQGHSRLRNNGNYCCLGVLCDISETGKWELYEEGDRSYWYYVVGDADINNVFHAGSHCLPRVLIGKLISVFHENELVRINDEEKHSFNHIADYIEKYILKGTTNE
jgi:hypothetical protein